MNLGDASAILGTAAHQPKPSLDRVALFGGTFDPPHIGHLVIAVDIIDRFELDRFFFVPAHQNPHKSLEPESASAHRLAMLRVAIAGQPKMGVLDWELNRPSPSYAVETAREARSAFPGARLFWVIGADQIPNLEQWKDFSELASMVTFLCVPRSGTTMVEPPARANWAWGSERVIDVGATEIRARIKASMPVDFLIHPDVWSYIKMHGLYSQKQTTDE